MRVLFLLILLALPFRANALDGNRLYEMCNQERAGFDSGLCHGYIAAITDVMAQHTIHGWSACGNGAKPTNQQLFDIVVVFLARNPQSRHYGAEGLVAKAISDAFPC